MIALLVEKELKNIFLSPKFAATFGVCSLLILLSVFIGIQDYQAQVDQYDTAVQLSEQQIVEETSWWSVDNRAYRKPSPLQIFVSGVNNDVGRYAYISEWTEVELEQSHYLNDTIFAVFRFIDLTFIFQVVLSLFAILFTYDAINGERESGTLKLALSNAVPRAQYVLSKFLGTWIGLAVPLLIPLLLGVLVVMVLRVPMAALDWSKVAMLLTASFLYFTFFVAIGILVSTLTKRSSVSFLILLVVWVFLALIIPRASTMAASQFVKVTTVAETSSQKERFQTDAWADYWRIRSIRQDEREAETAGMTEAEKTSYRETRRAVWLDEDNEHMTTVQNEIADYSRKLNEEMRNQKGARERLAFLLSRLSPSSAYQLAAMNIAGTNTNLKRRNTEAMDAYRTSFAQFVNTKRQADRQRNSNRRQNASDRPETLDLTELPRFEAPSHSFAEAVGPSIPDLGLLCLFSIGAFAGAFVSFLRYDVR